MERELTSQSLLRRTFIAANASAILLLSGCAAVGEPPTGVEPVVTAYLPDYTDNQALEQLASQPDIMQQVDRLDIAFAVPMDDGTVRPPSLSQEYIDVVNHTSDEADVLLSVGGWSIDGSRQRMVDNLHAAFDRPEIFVDSLIAARDNVAKQLGRDPETVGFDIDIERPVGEEKAILSDVVRKLDERQPTSLITIAIPTSDIDSSFDLPSLDEHNDGFNVMTYDNTVISTQPGARAGYIAPPESVIAAIDEVVEIVGDETKVSVGFPAYGYRFVGATAVGQSYDSAGDGRPSQVKLKDIPPETIGSDGLAQDNGAMTSVVTPEMLRSTMRQVRLAHPKILGSLVWTLDGANREFLDAMSYE